MGLCEKYFLEAIRAKLKKYIIDSNLKSLVLGISGGVDSALVASIAKPVCDELCIPLIGAWIKIESNKEDEEKRAINIGKALCTLFFDVDLTRQYLMEKEMLEEPLDVISAFWKSDFINSDKIDPKYFIIEESEYEKKIRLGNIKARQRMMYLYNLAQRYKGATLDTDNKTEHDLGFWTIHGDDFDLCLLLDLTKSEIYRLAKYVHETEMQGNLLMDCIEATPTDGLGITNSDVEQFGCDSYEEVDDILNNLLPVKAFMGDMIFNVEYEKLVKKHSEDKVRKVWERHLKSEFKRNLPININEIKL